MKVTYITHPDVVMDPDVPVPQWPLSEKGKTRMNAMLGLPWVKNVTSIWCSGEQKARDGATILGQHLGLEPNVHEGLGENDRSSTGFLSQDAFFAMRDRFFQEPEANVEGWESAVDAQRRIVATVRTIVAASPEDAHIAIIAHGGVGTLLLTSVMNVEISLDLDQPGDAGRVGGYYFVFNGKTWELSRSWRPVDP